MSQAQPIQQMSPQEGYTDKQAFFFPQYSFQQSLETSSSTPQSLSQPPKFDCCRTGYTPFPQLKSSTESTLDNKQRSEQEPIKLKKSFSLAKPPGRNNIAHNHRFRAPLPSTIPNSNPARYKPNLTPRPSVLRPHCLARDCLRLWVPMGLSTRQLVGTADETSSHEISDVQLERILDVMGSAWAQSTKETYGAGLLVFHVFCDSNNIDEEKRCPIMCNLLLDFLCSCAGTYSGSALANYAAGLKAWHTLHGREWIIPPKELKAVLDGATASAPELSKRPKRLPFRPDFILAICDQLNLSTPLDVAVFACLTTTFYAIARLGEFTVNTIKDFNPKNHIMRAGVSETIDCNNLPATRFHLPRTKYSPIEGEEAYWAEQTGLTNLKAALENHLRVNSATNTNQTHLFAWKHTKGMCPLSRKEFLKRVTIAAVAAGLPDLKGHGLRIGGTLEYLLRGVPFDVVKTMGRWSSEAFTAYLREHTTIHAPYIQASPVLEPFTRHTMPPIQ